MVKLNKQTILNKDEIDNNQEDDDELPQDVINLFLQKINQSISNRKK
jgi:hypothetical protein